MAMPSRQQPESMTDKQQIERRRKHRDPNAPDDWERIALERVTDRVKSLTDQKSTANDAVVSGGWEDDVVRRLERRIRELAAKK
jgi:hypothetical protein